jgi:hypothetical protein
MLSGCSASPPNTAPPGRAEAATATPRVTAPGGAAPGGPSVAASDTALLASAVQAERLLLGRAEMTLHRHSGLAELLRPVIEDHRAHLHALGGSARGHNGAPPAVPRDVRLALASVRRHEQVAAEARIANCVAAVAGDFARLLASIGASESQHAWSLARR